MNWLLIAHFAATWYMIGLIWFVQIVHYPLFASVPTEGFAAYENLHTRATSYVVIPPMLVELALAFFFLVRRPENLPLWAAVAGAALVVVIWLSTFLLQVPQHATLGNGFDARAHAVLVATNWLRTAAWTGRGIIAAIPFAASSTP